MKPETHTIEEMREQTKQILSTVSPEERGIVFEIDGEGGAIRIFKKRIKTKYVFIYQHNEQDFSDEELSVNKTAKYDSFESAFQQINTLYSIYFLYILTVHENYKEYISDQLVKKLNNDNISFEDFNNRERFEEILNVKLCFNSTKKMWLKSVENIDKLINEASKFQIYTNSNSYLISYPYFINYFANIQADKIETENLVIGIHFVYGWMPTIFEFKKNETKDLIVATNILKRAKRGEILISEDYQMLKELLNGSLVGTSKLLHFINPEMYAIWDSKVHSYLKKNFQELKLSYKIGDISNYEKYLNFLTEITNSEEFNKIYFPVNEKIKEKYKYTISNFRAIELLMFSNEKK